MCELRFLLCAGALEKNALWPQLEQLEACQLTSCYPALFSCLPSWLAASALPCHPPLVLQRSQCRSSLPSGPLASSLPIPHDICQLIEIFLSLGPSFASKCVFPENLVFHKSNRKTFFPPGQVSPLRQ
jgi:hypothetical protein